MDNSTAVRLSLQACKRLPQNRECVVHFTTYSKCTLPRWKERDRVAPTNISAPPRAVHLKNKTKQKLKLCLFHNRNMETLLSESRPLFKLVFTTHFWFYSKVALSIYKHFKIKLLFKHHLTSDHTFQSNNINTIVSKKKDMPHLVKCNPIFFDNQTFKTFAKTELWWGRKGWGGNNKQNIAELRAIQLIIYQPLYYWQIYYCCIVNNGPANGSTME